MADSGRRIVDDAGLQANGAANNGPDGTGSGHGSPDSAHAGDSGLTAGGLHLYAVDPADEAPESIYNGIGSELRAERLRCNLTLADVSDRLRIRAAYLGAIEDGRFGDLPGRIYAIGFLRSYAEFLGADGDVCVQLFKQEAGAGGHSKRLEFPVVPHENRRPGPLTLVLALALAGAVYAGWVMLQQDRSELVDLVPEVPEEIVRQVTRGDSRSATDLAATDLSATDLSGNDRTMQDPSPSDAADADRMPMTDAAGATDTAAGATSTVEASAPVVSSGTMMAAEAAPAPPAVPVRPIAASPVAASPVAVAPVADIQAAAPQVAAVQEQAQEPGRATTSAVADAPVAETTPASVTESGAPTADVQVALAPPPPPLPVRRAVATTAYQPRVFGIANSDARIVIRATDRAQVLVKQAGGQTVLPHRMMNAGDEYRAPNLDGLVLQSDNIDGLELIIDGENLGGIAGLADSRNMLALDPDWLLTRLQASRGD